MINEDIVKASRFVLLSIFNRFGDGVIASTVCREFIEKHASPDREFLILTSPQLFPYVKEVCKGVRVLCFRRKNPLDWIRVWALMKSKKGPTLGLNPCSYGKESKRLSTFADTFFFYRDLSGAIGTNHYDRVRMYLGLPLKGAFVGHQAFPNVADQILFCPESSERRRSLPTSEWSRIIGEIQRKWPNKRVVLCSSTDKSDSLPSSVVSFVFRKSRRSSEAFIDLVKRSDVVVSVDSGPAHIATAMGKPVVVFFSASHPASVMLQGAKCLALRASALESVFCEVTRCARPACMAKLTIEDDQWQAFKPGLINGVGGKSCPAGYPDQECSL